MGLLWTTVKRDHPSHSHSHHTTITENRAPTDESIRLYKEMEEKAAGNILGVYRIENNDINAEFAVFKNAGSHSVTVRMRMKINGNELTTSKVLDLHFLKTEMDLFKEAREMIVSKIGEHVTMELVSSGRLHGFGR